MDVEVGYRRSVIFACGFRRRARLQRRGSLEWWTETYELTAGEQTLRSPCTSIPAMNITGGVCRSVLDCVRLLPARARVRRCVLGGHSVRLG